MAVNLEIENRRLTRKIQDLERQIEWSKMIKDSKDLAQEMITSYCNRLLKLEMGLCDLTKDFKESEEQDEKTVIDAINEYMDDNLEDKITAYITRYLDWITAEVIKNLTPKKHNS